MRTLAQLAGVASIAAMVSMGAARGPERPDEGWAAHAETLARVVVAEADDRPADWAAILWVLEHRRARNPRPHAQVMAYSATLRASSPRLSRVYGPLERMSTARRRHIAKARRFVAAWLRGHVSDPCPDAVHWAGIGDEWPSELLLVSCGSTVNTFGREAWVGGK